MHLTYQYIIYNFVDNVGTVISIVIWINKNLDGFSNLSMVTSSIESRAGILIHRGQGMCSKPLHNLKNNNSKNEELDWGLPET